MGWGQPLITEKDRHVMAELGRNVETIRARMRDARGLFKEQPMEPTIGRIVHVRLFHYGAHIVEGAWSSQPEIVTWPAIVTKVHSPTVIDCSAFDNNGNVMAMREIEHDVPMAVDGEVRSTWVWPPRS